MPVEFIKCPCLHCGGSIEFESDAAGQETICPHCHKFTWVDVPGKMNYSPRAPKIPLEFVVAPPRIPAPPHSRGWIIWWRIRLVTGLFFLAMICGLGFSYLLDFSTPEERQLRKDIIESARRADSLNGKLEAAYKIHDLDLENQRREEWASEAVKTDPLTARLKTKINDRIQASNFWFWAALGNSIFWVPGVLYLFIVPRPKH